MNWNFLQLWILAVCCSSTVYCVYTERERPLTILHGTTKLSIDDEGINVFAIYSCEPGYHLHGESQLNCDTNTDEWQGNLPACKLEIGNNSSVSEIEPPEVIEPIGTAPPDITHQEIITTDDQLNGGIETQVTNQVSPQQEIQRPQLPEQENPEENFIESEIANTPVPPQKKGRKRKKPNAQEDKNIDLEFASRLDMSCADAETMAPQIENAHVADYIRASKGEYSFLVAVYECDVGSVFENPQYNRLYCSSENWIHNSYYPTCTSTETDEDYDSETDDVDQNGIDDANRNGVQQPDTNPVQPINEFDRDANKVDTIDQQHSTSTVSTNEQIAEQINTNEIGGPDSPQPTDTIDNVNHIPVDLQSCDINNGGCEQTCNMVPNEQNNGNIVECSCNEGFYLDKEGGTKCLDINEVYPNMQQKCPFGCENTIGSYYCKEGLDSEVEIITSNGGEIYTTEMSAPVKTCGNGMMLDASNNCVDIDECAQGNTGCEYCQNTVGSFECTCPDGFELASDQKSCRDIDECTAYAEYDYDENRSVSKSICSHECINTVGSYICKCPENYHLLDDKQRCEQDFCRHLGDIASNKTNCSHDCIDEADGYHCKCPDGMLLQADQKTCVDLDVCMSSGDRCLPGKCINTDDGSFKCDCPSGFAEFNQRCIDYDECVVGNHKCSHQCRNIDGSYLCECPEGLTLASDEHTCVTDDFCASDNGGCSDICNVVNGQVTCSCLDGAELDVDGKTCRRKNICSSNNGGCAHICNIELNICECNPGFETFDDGKTCHDLNECLQNNGGCPQQCINTEGDFRCTCFDGFVEDQQTGECRDRNECDVNNGNCDHECTNTDGSYFCSCRTGYRIAANQHQCFDINECEANNGNCSHICTNLQGSYQCSCPEGQFLVNDDHTCEFLNECEVNNGGCSHKCNYKKGVLTCSCPDGFELDEAGKVCIDQNECLKNNGGCAHICENLNGTHVCKCNDGYQLASDKFGCLDVDECIENNGNCSNICINLLGSYSCACEAGFELKDDKHTCFDIDECTDASHDCAQICVNVPGAYECECQPGYKLARDHLSCIDIDECALPNTCADATKCINTIGSFYCDCPTGYELSDNHQCVDKNECDEKESKQCSHTCVNMPGSFKCACPSGMELASDQLTCIDINECTVNAGICSHFCDNVEGSFRCRCPFGYELSDDQHTCKDIDECAIDNGGCDQKCVNIDGSSYCKCDMDGFVLADDQKHCISSDPCGIKNGGCSHVCEPVNGKAQCFCYKGFELSTSDNRSCSDINECLLNHGCESKCINTVGSYKCDCPKGFRLNAAGACEDVNECEVYENGGCSPNSECINFLGSFRCICPTVYKLDHDKVTCVEIKDSCALLPAPKFGDVHCTRSRHASQSFYRTRCSLWCNKGYVLLGPSVKFCNGSDGIWDPTETTCSPITCPPLPMPALGTLPENCVSDKVSLGESCVLSCPPGTKPNGVTVAQCMQSGQWSTTNLNCVVLKPHPRGRVTQGETHTQGVVNLQDPVQQKSVPESKEATPRPPIFEPKHHRTPTILRPYIKCPRDTTIVLPKNQKTVYVRLEQPKSNVDWASHVDANPPWAKNLQAHLGAGVHTITFTARSPNSLSISEACVTVITVKSSDAGPMPSISPIAPAAPISPIVPNRFASIAPQVNNCPKAIEVQLQPHEQQRAIFWIEPVFRSNQALKQIFRSHLPGTKFGAGHHKVTYIATDIRNQNSTCQFTVIVHPPGKNTPYMPQRFPTRLERQESYLLCPDRPAMKLDTSFPIQIPVGCFIKNVRVNPMQPYNPHRRRSAFSPNNNFLRYYSSWNQPVYNRYL